jgi:hypothetical protein
MRARIALALAILAVAGCKAQALTPGEPDLSTDDGGVLDLAEPDLVHDLAGADLRCSGPIGPEDCSNGCDDDRNGYTDEDDPACTPQVLATFGGGVDQPFLGRLLLGKVPKLVPFDGNPVLSTMCGVEYQRAFSPSIYLTREDASRDIRRIDPVDGGTGTVSDYNAPNTTFPGSARDACVFHGELVILERGTLSVLHRFKPDGMTELGTVALGSVNASACASDGNLLYVSARNPSMAGTPSAFLVFDQSYNSLGQIELPKPLYDAGLWVVLDFAWTKNFGFFGLFVGGTAIGSYKESQLYGEQLFPFALDGAVGDPIDAGTLHGIGEFLP